MVLNGAFIKLNNGSYANPVYLVINSGQSTAITRNSGHIISEKEGNYVQLNTADVNSNTDFVIPLGYSNTDYLPVTIHKNSVGSGVGHVNNASPIVVSTWGTPANNVDWANSVTNMIGLAGINELNSVIDRWWQVLAGTNVSATFDVTYRGVENTTSNPTGTFNAQQYDDPTDIWLLSTGSGAGVTTGTGAVNNIDLIPHGLSVSTPFILSCNLSPLPIDLISFTSNCTDNVMNINWTTASEINVVNIELQKSYDLSVWTTIYTALPSNKISITNYSFSDTEISDKVIYYRLKTNNNDGNFDLSEEISATPCGVNADFLNAFSDGNTIQIHSVFQNSSNVNYSLFDIQGKLITIGNFNANTGNQLYSITLEQIASAIYLFRAESSTTMCNQKLLITTP
ncbi:MAG: T9SS type A sorting domain-containing protein [Bacteroidia bacterium]|nr:T9SS type A sorting domain-containing protein [Bacteroidia bacterium]